MDIRSLGNAVHPSAAPVEKRAPAAEPSVAVKPVAQPEAVAAPPPTPSLAQITQAINSINQAMKTMSQDLEFSVDEDSNRTIVKVVDQKTKEVLRQIPSTEALAIAKALDQAQGLLIKQKA